MSLDSANLLILACAECGRQSAVAAKILWAELMLMTVPFALAGLGFWIFRREMFRSRSGPTDPEA